MNKFENEYKKLNKEQRVAVEAVEGPVMVVAGPGTGKTQILTLRIANILKKTQIEPENILALTFTEAAAANIRKRLAEIIGASAYSVNISTFHGFANSVIQSNPENFPNILGATNITEIDQLKVLEDIIVNTDFKFLKTFGDPTYYIRDIAKAISDLKREGISPEDFKTIVEKQKSSFDQREDTYHERGAHKGKMKSEAEREQRYIHKNIELVQIYKEYQLKLRQMKTYDFGDMILGLYGSLKRDDNLLRSLQETYQYVLVDEHQDTNNAQNKIVELLMSFHENPNIFVVGDEKQAIFRFQGASLENFYYFKKIYPAAKLIYLTSNYRSGQTILDLADSLIESKKKLKSHKINKTTIRLYELSSPDEEAHFIAQKVKELIDSGAEASEIGILFRDNNDANLLVDYLEKLKIKYDLKSSQNLFENKYIKQLICILRALNSYGNDILLVDLLHLSIFKQEPLDIYKVLKLRQEKRVSLYDLIRDKKLLHKYKIGIVDEIYNIYYLLTHWKNLLAQRNLIQLTTDIVRDSGLLAKVLSDKEGSIELERLNLFIDRVKALNASKSNVSLGEFIEYLDSFKNYNVRLEAKINITSKDSVKLMTAHGSKGLEFENVFIAGMFDGHWGNKRKKEMIRLPESIYELSGKEISAGNDNDDERRLLFVALTRAKRQIFITYPTKNYDGGDLLPSMFLSEIDGSLITKKPIDIKLDNTLQFKPNFSSGPSVYEKEFIISLFKENNLSVTGLNNYLECPWNYFYNNLLRIPRAKDKHASYGTAVHNALKDLFSVKQGTVGYLLKQFEHHLESERLVEVDYNETLTRGKKALTEYFKKYNNTWSRDVLLEYNIPAVDLGDIKITGKIDKIEILDSANNVNVVDYKTGRSKTRNELMGKTQNATGNEKRQLVFYKLLLDGHKNGLYKMKSGEVDFVQPDAKSNFRKEQFYITDEDASELKKIIFMMTDEILNMKFWDKRCGDNKCQYCNLRNTLD